MLLSRLCSSKMGLVGVDFASHSVKLLQVREHRGALHVVGASRVDMPLARAPHPRSVANGDPSMADSPQPGDSTVAPEIAHDGFGAPLRGPDAAPSPETERLAHQLRAAFAAGGFTGRRCVISLAREDVCLQSVRLPKMPDDELRQTVIWEAAQRFGFERSAMEVDFMRTGATVQTADNREEIILIAASHAAIHARVEPVLASGLRPVAVETGFSALARTFSRQARRDADRDVVRTVVDVGYSGSTMLILRGDQVAFCKSIAIGGVHFNRAVAEHLQISEQTAAELRAARVAAAAALETGDRASAMVAPGTEGRDDAATGRAVYEAVRPLLGELVKEVSLCLRYYGVTFRGQPPARIILAGGDALEPKFGAMLAQVCKVPVTADDEASTLTRLIGEIQNTMNRAPGPTSTWAVAVGLSMRGMLPRKSARAVLETIDSAGRQAAA